MGFLPPTVSSHQRMLPESHLLRHIRETRRNMKAINTKAKPAKPGFLIMAPRGKWGCFRHFWGYPTIDPMKTAMMLPLFAYNYP